MPINLNRFHEDHLILNLCIRSHERGCCCPVTSFVIGFKSTSLSVQVYLNLGPVVFQLLPAAGRRRCPASTSCDSRSSGRQHRPQSKRTGRWPFSSSAVFSGSVLNTEWKWRSVFDTAPAYDRGYDAVNLVLFNGSTDPVTLDQALCQTAQADIAPADPLGVAEAVMRNTAGRFILLV